MEMVNVLGIYFLKRVVGFLVWRMLRRWGGKERIDGEGCLGGGILLIVLVLDVDVEIL